MPFNLIDQAWIPCVTIDGELTEVSLRDMLARAPELREISCEKPIQSAAILPMALALLHRVFGPAGPDQWEALWRARAFDMARLDAYFAEWHDRFDLFHPKRPFYQAPDKRAKRKSILYLAEPIANTHTLFNHVTEADSPRPSPAEAARRLLQAQAFRLGGGQTGIKGLQYVDSTFARGILFFAVGRNLFDTLVLNLIRYPDKRILKTGAKDKPHWERRAPLKGRKPDSKVLEIRPNGYLDYLTWQTNHIELFYDEGEMTLAPVAKPDADVRSPQMCFVRDKKLKFQRHSALWRIYPKLLARSEAVKLPAVVAWLNNLAAFGHLDERYPVQLMATGMLAIKTKPIVYRQELMPFPLQLARSRYRVQVLRVAVEKAEDLAVALRKALNILARRALQQSSSNKAQRKDCYALVDRWKLLERYWFELEPLFWHFIDELLKDIEDAIAGWEATLRRVALDALDIAASRTRHASGAIRGHFEAERCLYRKMRVLLENASDMAVKETREEPGISFLEKNRGDRGLMATLRLGLGAAPGAVPEMDRYVLPFAQPGDEGLIFMLFSLFALHPESTKTGNMGDHMRALDPARKKASVERRFIQLQKTQRNKLAPLLRQEIEILKSKGIAVNWHQLMNDLRYWDHHKRYARRRWRWSFWTAKRS